MPRRTYHPLPLSAAALERIDRVARALAGGNVSQQKLAEAVAALSHAYTRDRARLRELDGTKEALYARLCFFFARDLVKVFGPLDELRESALFRENQTLRVLDVGAGFGATSLGLARWLRLRALQVERLHVVALEQNATALRSLQALARALAELPEEFAPVSIEARHGDLEQTRLSERYDLVTFGFVLNELFSSAPLAERLEKRLALLLEASERLRDGGAIIVLEPALKESARELMMLRDLVVQRGSAPFVIAPCVHALNCPMLPSERDWCHQELPYALPAPLADVARAASLRYEGLSYASLVLAKSARAALPPHTVRVVSDRLESKGKLELFGCSEAGYVRLTRLTRKASAANAAFESAQRGDLLSIGDGDQRIEEDTSVVRRSPAG